MRRLPPGPAWTFTKLPMLVEMFSYAVYIPAVVQNALLSTTLRSLGLLLLLHLGSLRLDLTGTREGTVDFTHLASVR